MFRSATTNRTFNTTAWMTALALAAGLLFDASQAKAAAVSYSGLSSTYSQDFDSLPNTPNGGTGAWTNGTTLQGWHARANDVAPTTIRVTEGQAFVDQLLSEGSIASSERALGTQSQSGTAEMTGVQISNDTGLELFTFTATYDGEQWREVGVDIEDQLTVEYQIFASGGGSLTAASGWTALPDLTFDAPQTAGGSSTPLDGNDPANRVAGLTTTVTGLSWAAGDELWIRWIDQEAGNRRQHLAVDNFAFSANIAVPEPSTFALLALGVAGFALRRRVRKSAVAISLALVMFASMLCTPIADAAQVTAITTAEWGTPQTMNNTATLTSYSTASNPLVSTVNFAAATSVTPEPGGYFHGQAIVDPGSSAGLGLNMDLTTGYLNHGVIDYMFDAVDRHWLATGAVGADNDFVIFQITANDTGQTAQALDASGTPIGSTVSLTSGTALSTWMVAGSIGGGADATWNIEGKAFDYDDFGVANATLIGGIRISGGGNFDPSLV
ncbi:MAG: PEP-CTERM sorting domain-containing protein, partial [Planctomycetales bacterium]|nr:PEP-CTERM sorting domain-containing protein [Planctomycetales bacterium]